MQNDISSDIQASFYHKLHKDDDMPDFLIRQIFSSDPIYSQESNLTINQKALYMSQKINQIYDLKINTPLIQFEQDTTFEDKKVDSMLIGKRIMDLHGYTKLASLQGPRRLLLLLDKSHPNVVKFNVGIGSHSEPSKDQQQNSEHGSDEFHHTTRECVRQVCKELNLPSPQSYERNHGILIERLSASVFNENVGT